MDKGLKKTEKLASAMYLLTSFFEDKEPMKWRLRELVGKLLTGGSVHGVVLEITSLLHVAKNAGLISDTNFNIVEKEFSTLATQTLTIGEMLKEDKVLEKSPEEKATTVIGEKPNLYLSSSVITSRPTKDKPAREAAQNGLVAEKKNGRQGTILTLLKRKGQIMIKDITPLIAGVSEKTIQRELLSMVSNGLLKKEGGKRWSRYSLAE